MYSGASESSKMRKGGILAVDVSGSSQIPSNPLSNPQMNLALSVLPLFYEIFPFFSLMPSVTFFRIFSESVSYL